MSLTVSSVVSRSRRAAARRWSRTNAVTLVPRMPRKAPRSWRGVILGRHALHLPLGARADRPSFRPTEPRTAMIDLFPAALVERIALARLIAAGDWDAIAANARTAASAAT